MILANFIRRFFCLRSAETPGVPRQPCQTPRGSRRLRTVEGGAAGRESAEEAAEGEAEKNESDGKERKERTSGERSLGY